MCLAIPGKIMQIKNSVATIDYVGEKRQARIVAGTTFKKGDYVIVMGKVVVEKVGKKAAEKWLKTIRCI